MVPNSSLLVGLRSVKQAASFMLAGVPDQEHKGFRFSPKNKDSKMVYGCSRVDNMYWQRLVDWSLKRHPSADTH